MKQEKAQPENCDWKDDVKVCGFCSVCIHVFSWHNIWILYNAFHLKASEMFYAVQHFHCTPVLVNKASEPEVILAKVEWQVKAETGTEAKPLVFSSVSSEPDHDVCAVDDKYIKWDVILNSGNSRKCCI